MNNIIIELIYPIQRVHFISGWLSFISNMQGCNIVM